MSNLSKEKTSSSAKIDRRSLLRHGAAIAAAVTLPNLMSRQAKALGPIASPYGAPVPTADENTGLDLLQLPPGFKYWSFGWTGDPLHDGHVTPALHDGMTIAKNVGPNGSRFLLIRNHEVAEAAAFANGPIRYSPMGGGGNTNFVWDPATKRITNSWASLSGTVRNCSGGVTPWNSWISCEETTIVTNNGKFKHGYCFDVLAESVTKHNSTPIKAMGRFAHEALCVDPATYHIYETEDGPSFSGDVNASGFYRFIPNDPTTGGVPNLQLGGTLQMLKIVGTNNKDLRSVAAPQTYATEWVTIAKPDPNWPAEPSPFMQGHAQGGALFARLEGCFFGLGKVYFNSTTGGPNTEGQVWEYDPTNEILRLIYNSARQADCENPDNIVVTPNGALILCEDNSGGTSNDSERLLGVTLAGDIFTFAKNNLNFTAGALGNYTRPESGTTFTMNYRQQEWAGACFDNTGEWMFVNIQTPGITFAITGPWSLGPF